MFIPERTVQVAKSSYKVLKYRVSSTPQGSPNMYSPFYDEKTELEECSLRAPA